MGLCIQIDQEYFNVDRLSIAIAKVSKAAGEDPANFAYPWLHSPRSLSRSIIRDLERIANKALQEAGKISVRYLGDLKESQYSLAARFFYSADGHTDFPEMLKEILAQSKEEDKITLINLANVREIIVDVGDKNNPGLKDDILFLNIFIRAFKNERGIVMSKVC